jgi:hypothetical protein
VWCLMLFEPVCGIQIHGKGAMGFSDLLVGVYGYGRGDAVGGGCLAVGGGCLAVGLVIVGLWWKGCVCL